MEVGEGVDVGVVEGALELLHAPVGFGVPETEEAAQTIPVTLALELTVTLAVQVALRVPPGLAPMGSVDDNVAMVVEMPAVPMSLPAWLPSVLTGNAVSVEEGVGDAELGPESVAAGVGGGVSVTGVLGVGSSVSSALGMPLGVALALWVELALVLPDSGGGAPREGLALCVPGGAEGVSESVGEGRAVPVPLPLGVAVALAVGVPEGVTLEEKETLGVLLGMAPGLRLAVAVMLRAVEAVREAGGEGAEVPEDVGVKAGEGVLLGVPLALVLPLTVRLGLAPRGSQALALAAVALAMPLPVALGVAAVPLPVPLGVPLLLPVPLTLGVGSSVLAALGVRLGEELGEALRVGVAVGAPVPLGVGVMLWVSLAVLAGWVGVPVSEASAGEMCTPCTADAVAEAGRVHAAAKGGVMEAGARLRKDAPMCPRVA